MSRTPKISMFLIACSITLFGCAGSATFVGYEKPELPATELAKISFDNSSPFETRLWTFKDPLVCNQPVVKTVENGFANDRIRQHETIVRHGERGQPFSFYVGFFSGGTAQWREIRQIVTFVPGDAEYEISLGAVGEDGRLEKGGFAIAEISNGRPRSLDSHEFVVRAWRPASMMETGWAAPLTEDELQTLGIEAN